MEQMERPTKWTLHDLLPEPVERSLKEAFARLEQALVEFEARREILTPEITWQDFNEVLGKLEAITLIKSRIEAYADRFLKQMVRAMVGTLVEVGLGKRSAASLRDILTTRDRSAAGKTAPAHGLYLVRVDY